MFVINGRRGVVPRVTSTCGGSWPSWFSFLWSAKAKLCYWLLWMGASKHHFPVTSALIVVGKEGRAFYLYVQATLRSYLVRVYVPVTALEADSACEDARSLKCCDMQHKTREKGAF
uniref:Transmembrane protein n=1 Tax=Panagrellus redivivus TaxID=6233 RepID=A0A7E4V461_PANRE